MSPSKLARANALVCLSLCAGCTGPNPVLERENSDAGGTSTSGEEPWGESARDSMESGDPSSDQDSSDGDGSPPSPECGNGILEVGEFCDDGNDDDSDACPSTCEPARCGDGFVGPGETCDDANLANGDGCDAKCQLEECGNGVVDLGEDCDDGNGINEDDCLANCEWNRCGDSFLNPSTEECDDGNDIPDDACSNDCEVRFYSGSQSACTSFGQRMCSYFEASCHVVPAIPGDEDDVCHWSDRDSRTTCNAAPGTWMAFESEEAEAANVSVPLEGACVAIIGRMACSAAEQQVCENNGADLCFRPKGVNGEDTEASGLCWWDVDEAGCEGTVGVWSIPGSFANEHPNALPPSGTAQCLRFSGTLD